MCFSAPVSFTTSAALAVVGVMALRTTQTKRELPFASVPLLFAIQQFIEGMLWLSLPEAGSSLRQYWLTQGYAFFIGVVWPVLVPLSLLFIEPRIIKRHFIKMIVAVGVVVAVYTLSVITHYGVSAEVVNKCVVYQYPGDDHPAILVTYLIATCMAFFFSSHRSVLWIGIINIIGFIVSYYFFRLNYTSVWCLFAAIISGLIYTHLLHNSKNKPIDQAVE